MIACCWVQGCRSEGRGVAEHAGRRPLPVCIGHAVHAWKDGWSLRPLGHAGTPGPHSSLLCSCDTPALSLDPDDWTCIACTRFVRTAESVLWLIRHGQVEAAEVDRPVRARVQRVTELNEFKFARVGAQRVPAVGSTAGSPITRPFGHTDKATALADAPTATLALAEAALAVADARLELERRGGQFAELVAASSP